MVSHGERRFDESDVAVLNDYAGRMDARGLAEFGDLVAKGHTDAVRTIADKIVADIEGQRPAFTLGDAEVVWNVSAALEQNARVFEGPNITEKLRAEAPRHRERATQFRAIAELIRDRAAKREGPRRAD